MVLALPGLASSLSNVIFQLADLTFISRLGDAPMASVVIVNQTLRQTFFMLLMGGSFGTQALIAGAVGAGNVERAEHILVFLLNFGLVGTLFFNSILTGAGDTTTPFFVMLFQTAVALSAEWVLIFGHLGAPALGVRGVALGIAAGQISAMAAGLSVLFGGRARVHLRWRYLVPDPAVLRRIARLSWPPALQMLGTVATAIAFLRLAGDFGAPVQAAYAIGLRLGMIAPIVCFPLAGACATIVGQTLGAGNAPRAWRMLGVGLLVHGTVMMGFATTLLLFRSEILALFTSDAEVIRAGSEYLWYLALSFMTWAVYFVLMRSLQGAGDVLVPMAISLGTTFLVTLPLAWLLARQLSFGPTGIWRAQLAGSILLTTATTAWVATGRWTRRAARPATE
jgi:putative MATE family efflux protein